MNLEPYLWMIERACRDAPLGVFFDELPGARPELDYCAVCPVAWECLHHGGTQPGIWGGMKEEERRVFLNTYSKEPARFRAFRRHHRDLYKRASLRRSVKEALT